MRSKSTYWLSYCDELCNHDTSSTNGVHLVEKNRIFANFIFPCKNLNFSKEKEAEDHRQVDYCFNSWKPYECKKLSEKDILRNQCILRTPIYLIVRVPIWEFICLVFISISSQSRSFISPDLWGSDAEGGTTITVVIDAVCRKWRWPTLPLFFSVCVENTKVTRSHLPIRRHLIG